MKPILRNFNLIIQKLEDPKTTYRDLRELLPKDMGRTQCISLLRKINTERVKKKINKVPRDYRKIPSTVQTYETHWKNPKTGNLKPIKIVGFRHGAIKVNENSRHDLKKHIGNESERILLLEDSLIRNLKNSDINIKGKDIKDQSGYTNKIKAALQPITLFLLPILFLYRFITQNRNGLHKHLKEYPSYYDQASNTAKQLPEHIEIELHKNLPQNEAEKLDKGFIRHNLLHGRSGYMAGYITAISEEMKNTDKSIVFACGGAHLPRIASYLELGSRENIPPSLLKDFDKGYKKALEHSKKDTYLQPEFHQKSPNNIANHTNSRAENVPNPSQNTTYIEKPINAESLASTLPKFR